MSVKVFTAEEALAAATTDATKVLTVEKKKDDKAYKGTRFLIVYFNIGSDIRKTGWFSIENVPLSAAYADPKDKKDKRNEYDGTRQQLETTVSRAGAFGQFLAKLNPEWIKLANGIMETDPKAKGRKIHGLIQTHLSETNEKNPGGVIEDPVIRFQVDYGTFPATFPLKFMAGQPKFQIFDWDTRYIDEAGREQFKIAMVKNDQGVDEPVTDENAYKFITKGSIIRKGRIYAPSGAISQSWISCPISITKCVLQRGAEEGFSDEAPVSTPVANTNVEAALTQTTTVTTAPTPAAPVTQAPTAQESVTGATIDDLLADI